MKQLLAMALLALCGGPTLAAPARIDGERLLEHMTTLASDEFEGRAPGTRGETLTIDYLQQQFKKLGLAPGNPDGTYVQAVPLVAISSHPTLRYVKNGEEHPLVFGDDYVAWTARTDKKIAIANSELVFVGYGVQAPEFKWDDYKGIDLKGKTLVMLINDPPLTEARQPKRLDPTQFGGSAITRYGRWDYKFEMAAKLGAAAALIVHETKPAGYPYEVVRNSWGRENFALQGSTPSPYFPAIAGWLQGERARELFKAGGHDFDALKQQALQRSFQPVPLGVQLNVTALNAWRELSSHNVVGKIVGSDPQLRNEVVLYSAHWDHFGIDDSLPGPRSGQIFHGAMDNAAGVAALLEIARAYQALPVAPKRSIVFLLTTAEERGLLGAQSYVRNPLYPLDKTVLNLNIDGLNLWGRTRDVELSGMGKSSADELVISNARIQGRGVRPDSNADSGSFYRGDQFEFARAGVPVIYLRNSSNFVGKPASYGRDKLLHYSAHQYHTVNDTVQTNWDTSGAIDDINLLFQAGYQAAQGKTAPQWKANAEFKR